MWFKIERSQLDFTATAPFHLINEAVIAAPPEKVFEVLANDTWKHWFKDFVSVHWTSPAPYGIGSTREVRLKAMSVKETFLAWEPGKRFSFSIDEVTLPLLKAMIEDIQLSSVNAGDTQIKWAIYYEPLPIMRLIHPIARAIFGNMFRQSLEGLKRYAEKE